MPVHILYFSRNVFRAYFIIVFTTSFLLFSHTAYADPHAVFYTDRAQEQVFFNTLAALNQADFVEPGIPGQPFSRSILLDRRSNATARPTPLPPGATPTPTPPPGDQRFLEETNPLIKSTRTDLPGVVSRNITLEGDDLWTAYLVHQFALETSTRRAASELARLYCTRGLGKSGCSINPGPSQNQETAFVRDPSTYNQESLSEISALLSGTQSEQKLQADITNTGIGSDEFALFKDSEGRPISGPSHPGPPNKIPEIVKFPRAFDSSLAQLRETNKDTTTALEHINDITSGVIASQYNSDINPDTFANIEFDSDGKPKTPKDITFDEYMQTSGDLASLQYGSYLAAAKAEEEGQKFKEYREDSSIALADYKLSKQQGGGVKATITIPSSAKKALVDEGGNLLTSIDVNQKYANPQAIVRPGKQTVNTRGEVAGATTRETQFSSTGEVKAATTTILSDTLQQYYDADSLQTNSPASALDSPDDEPGLRELRAAYGIALDAEPTAPGAAAEECGFCVAFDKKVQGITQNAQRIISDVYAQLQCVLFARDPSCQNNAP